MESKKANYTGLEIAVIGMSGRFPGANNIDGFWHNLKSGKESISFFSDEELLSDGVDEKLVNNSGYIKAKGILEGIEFFDSGFFDFTPGEANVIDPQIRIFHECVWNALENAGYIPEKYNGLIGLYAGYTPNMAWNVSKLLQNETGADQFVIGNLNSNFFTTLLSYKLNLKGPSVAVQTACSTSLVAIHNACRALLTGETDIALAGGITISLPNKQGYIYQEGMVMSPDGHLRAFDKDARGIVNGNGAGVVVLKRLNDAINDNDNILAIVRSSAINNDGNRKVGYTAPSIEGQAEVIRAVHQMAEIESESVSYIEAHGTGTSFGDPVEIEALTKAFNTDKKQFCAIGSLKSNVGHLDCAAGVAGFIKTVLSLQNRQIAPSINFIEPNPKIKFENSPFYVNTKLKEWKNEKYPLRAGLSSFGIGGTNAHILLEEAPVKEYHFQGRKNQMVLLSAKTEKSLNENTERLVDFIKNNPSASLADLTFTLQTGRADFKYRKALVCENIDEAINNLPSEDKGKVIKHLYSEKKPKTIFMFSGQGSQYIHMGKGLYDQEEVFRAEMDKCFSVMDRLVDYSIKEVLYPTIENEDTRIRINQIDKTPVLNFIIEYAITKLLMHWGIKPYAMIGHSIGEYVCACISGVMTLEDTLKLIVLRGKLMSTLPSGVMMSIPLERKDIQKYINNEVSFAADHGYSCIVSGSNDVIDNLENDLKADKIMCQRLSITHAGHSNQMKNMEDKFIEGMAGIKFNTPQIPYISNITGEWITVEQATSKQYWAEHVSQTVQFAKGIHTILENDNNIFFEIGPGNVLSTIVLQLKSKDANQFILNTIKYPNQPITDQRYMLNRIARYWLYGGKIDWKGYYSSEQRSKMALPGYSFEKKSYSADVIKVSDLGKKGLFKELSGNSKKPDLDDWFYLPAWKNTIKSRVSGLTFKDNKFNWLVFANRNNASTLLTNYLKALNHEYTVVNLSAVYEKINDHSYNLGPEATDGFQNLFTDLKKYNRLPGKIIYLWSFFENEQTIDDCINYSYKYICNLAKSFFQIGANNPLEINAITNGVYKSQSGINFYNSIISGPLNTIPLEYPTIKCKNIDIPYPEITQNLQYIINECVINIDDNLVLLNNNKRLIKTFEPVTIAENIKHNNLLKTNGCYVITGGLGGIALTIAEFLSEKYKARLLLLEKNDFPDEANWEDWIKSHESDDNTSIIITKLKKIKRTSKYLQIETGDISDFNAIEKIINKFEQTSGNINGVFHCAGYTKGGLIQTKQWETVENTFNPKIRGTLVLDKIFGDRSIDFMVLFSSLNSILPAMGLVDYFSANAFMDAYSQSKSIENKFPVICINWEAWKKVGGAVNATKEMMAALKDYKKTDIGHPLFEYKLTLDNKSDVFISEFSASSHWVLNEHRIDNKATMPGTGYIEMMYEAARQNMKSKSFILEDVFLIKPFDIPEDASKIIYTVVKNINEAEKEIYILSKPAHTKVWITHVSGKIIKHENTKSIVDWETFDESFSGNDIIEFTKAEVIKNEMVTFGERWLNNFIRFKNNKDHKFIHLKLPEKFKNDFEEYNMHPGLLDTALAVNQSGKFFLPLYYKKIKINASLPNELYSCITRKEQAGDNMVSFDISILNMNGEEIINIEDYTLVSAVQGKENIHNDKHSFTDISSIKKELQVINKLNQSNKSADDYIDQGIEPTEGIEIIERVLGTESSQIIVSTSDFNTRVKHHFNVMLKNIENEGPEDADDGVTGFGETIVLAANELEDVILNTWKDFLGIDQISVHDNFFEIGATSLAIIQVSIKLKKILRRDIPVVSLYVHPTTRELANHLSGNNTDTSLENNEYLENKNSDRSKLRQRKQHLSKN